MKYSINIENPCSQDYSLMKDNYAGRFCSVCEKSVIDFTKLSDDEILRILKQNNFKVCGRLSEKQLNKTLLQTQNKNYFLSFLKVVSGILLFGATEKSVANHQTKEKTFTSIFNQDFKNKSIEVQNDSLKRIIRGNVISAEDGLSLPGAVIKIEETTLETYTDLDGNFTIEIPEELKENYDMILNVSYIGRNTIRKQIFYEYRDESEITKITLYSDGTMEEFALGGAITVKKWYQFWKWKIFRKKYKP